MSSTLRVFYNKRFNWFFNFCFIFNHISEKWRQRKPSWIEDVWQTWWFQIFYWQLSFLFATIYLQPSAGKGKTTVFWNAKCVIMWDHLTKRSTITKVYYANLLEQLKTAYHAKCRDKVHICKNPTDAVERKVYE